MRRTVVMCLKAIFGRVGRSFLLLMCLSAFCASPVWANVEYVTQVDAFGDDTGIRGGSIDVSGADPCGLIGPASPSVNITAKNAAVSRNCFTAQMSGDLYQSKAYEMLDYINRERVSKGIAAVKWDADLERSAITRAAEVSIMFSHTRPNGDSCSTAFPENLSVAGENIATGYDSVWEAYNAWKNSPGHYANMMNPSFTHVGISCFYGGAYGYCWVQTFGARSGGGNETPSGANGLAYISVILPDSFIRSIDWTADSLTPGVKSMRALPAVSFGYDGVLDDGVSKIHIAGNVSYDWSMFSWSTADEKIAAFAKDQSSFYSLGIAEGSTTYTAYFAGTPRLDKTFPVHVTKTGSFIDVVAGQTDHASSILWLSGTGVSAGYNDGSFRPYIQVARCDMAAFLRRLASALSLGDASTWVPSGQDWKRFSDISANTPHAEDVLWLAHAGISEGYPDGAFLPYANVARCDMAAFLKRLAAMSPASDANTWAPSKADWTIFKDVSSETYHAEDILWLRHAGISLGYAGGVFKPFAEVARCDMAAFLERLSQSAA